MLRDALVRSRTRLLILHSLGDHLEGDHAERLAELVAGAGAGQVGCRRGRRAQLDAYFLDLYARILSATSRSRKRVAAPESGPSTLLVYGTGGDQLLRFDGVIERPDKQLGYYSQLVKKLLRWHSRHPTWPAPGQVRAHLRRIALSYEFGSYLIDTEFARRLAHARTSVGASRSGGGEPSFSRRRYRV